MKHNEDYEDIEDLDAISVAATILIMIVLFLGIILGTAYGLYKIL